ncbi:unnamed protein product [Toxocara canis]|uniref:Transmembrane protein n=1 Tax=Toxocara canis TaxID=6265 RepID=A0A183TYN3_TOXCA|nr:unnamed protein product [Toxocara canis]
MFLKSHSTTIFGRDIHEKEGAANILSSMKRIILVAITLVLLVAVVSAGVTFSEQRQLDEIGLTTFGGGGRTGVMVGGDHTGATGDELNSNLHCMKYALLILVLAISVFVLVSADIQLPEEKFLVRRDRVKRQFGAWGWRRPYWGYGWRRPYWGYWG